MRFSLCPTCGGPPEGTVDTIPAIARLIQLDDGTFEYEGDTRVCWNGQTTNTDMWGCAVLWCGACDIEYPNREEPAPVPTVASEGE